MDVQEFDYVKQKIQELVGLDISSYKEPQLQRRLHTFLLRSGHPDWPSFFRAAGGDPSVVRKLKDYLNVSVSAFFRDPEKYAYLKEVLLPTVLRTRPAIRVWSAGCTDGQEPYSLAMVLAETTRSPAAHYILATDIDEDAIERARSGGPYPADEVKDVSELQRRRYFSQTPQGYEVTRELRERVMFRCHNLLIDAFEGPFDLIACRNVAIYFAPEIRDTLYRGFCDALLPGGILFVGGTEIIPESERLGFESVGVSFYRRRADDATT
jgi:chemotaxis protein methyltransferase CheR